MRKIKIKTTQAVTPMIYAYTTPGIAYHDGWTKIGYTERDVDARIKEQTRTANIIAHKEWQDLAVFTDGKTRFTDKEFHSYLSKNDIERKEPQPDDEGCPEWFKISGDESYVLFGRFRRNLGVLDTIGVTPYTLRHEQKEFVNKTKEYFMANSNPECLWNAKPRFGKTLSAYDLCAKLQAAKILIVTNRPAIANSWYEDYVKFFGTESGYYFVSNVYFGGEYDKLKEVADLNWDVLIIDEAHEGVDTNPSSLAMTRTRYSPYDWAFGAWLYTFRAKEHTFCF